jgi:hypothetical protein
MKRIVDYTATEIAAETAVQDCTQTRRQRTDRVALGFERRTLFDCALDLMPVVDLRNGRRAYCELVDGAMVCRSSLDLNRPRVRGAGRDHVQRYSFSLAPSSSSNYAYVRFLLHHRKTLAPKRM